MNVHPSQKKQKKSLPLAMAPHQALPHAAPEQVVS